jgi:acyl-coenzyme A synthetase/AMP-(fatty) acid ligase
MSVPSLSRLFSQGRTGVVALRHGQAVSFERFRADVVGVAQRMRGMRRGGLFCQDSYAFAVGLFGLLHAGAGVVLPANAQPGTLRALAGHFDCLLGDEVLGGPPAEGELAPLDADKPLVDFFTSGSTGAPKHIAKTLGQLEREVATLETAWGDRLRDGPVLATVTHQHFYGFIFKLAWPLAVGRCFAGEIHEFWESLLAQPTGGTAIISSPAHLGRLTGLSALSASARPAAVFSAGAPLSADAADTAAAVLGQAPIEIFGSTETGAFATRQGPEDAPWHLLPGNELRLDEAGRMSVRSPYCGDGAWLAMADLAEAVPGGFRFRGRADRVVKIEGKRISLAEVEQALLRLPWVDAAALVVLPGAAARLAAAVVPSGEGKERLAALGAFRFGRLLRHGLADTQEPAGMPRVWRFVEQLPAGSLGKRTQADLAALFAGEP